MKYLVAFSLAGFALGAATLANGAPYALEKTHGDLLFAVDHAGFTRKHGLFHDFDATLEYDAEHPERSQLDVTVQAASIDTGLARRDADLKGTQFLDVAQFPRMTFTSTRVVPGAGDRLEVEGELTLHGVTRPLTISAHLNKAAPNPFSKQPTLGFSATASLKRSDFGIATFVPVIGDEIAITIDVEFGRKP